MSNALNQLIMDKTKNIMSDLGNAINQSDFDPLREVGMDRGKIQRKRRLQAMTDAQSFTQEKEQAYGI
jgi:hypothetical protein